MPWKDESGGEPPRAAGGPWGGGSGGEGGGNNGGSPWNRPGGGGSGGGGGGGDLEDQMRRMQERFRRGRSGGGGSGGRGQRPSFGPGGLFVLLGAALLAWLATGIVIVDEGERAAVFRFGQYQSNLNPGFHIRFPTPIETHEVMPAQSQQTTVIGQTQEESLMLTGDENIVDVQFRVRWFYDARSPEDFILQVDHEEGRGEASRLVKAVAESVMREVVGRSTLDQVITTGRGDIEDDVLKDSQELLNYYVAGVSLSEVQLLPTQPPAPVRAAFLDVVNAGQDAERMVEDATRFANEIIPRARGDAEKVLQDAEAYRDKVIADSTGEAARFEQILDEYRQAPRVTRERMYLETMEKVLGNAEKLVLDNESGAVPYLPIDRVQRGGGN